MGFLESGVFWGSLLVLWGLSIIVQTVFHIHIPFFRIAFALIVIWIGLKILTGGRPSWHNRHSIMFSDATFPATPIQNRYEIVFGEGTIDLTAAEPGKTPSPVTVNVVFGSATVKVDPKKAVRIRATTSLGNINLPEGRTSAVGATSWESKAAKGRSDVLEFRLNAVFGNIEVRTE